MKKLTAETLSAIHGGNVCPITDPMGWLYCNGCSPGVWLTNILNGNYMNYVEHPERMIICTA